MSGSRLPRLQIVVTEDALQDLAEIGKWNIQQYGHERATRYVRSLLSSLNRLDEDLERSRVVEARTDYRFCRLGKKRGGHGHIAVFHVLDETLTVLRIFHTAQDWQSRLP